MDLRGEQLALDYQAGVLRELGAPAKYRTFLNGLRANPRYQEIGRVNTGRQAPSGPAPSCPAMAAAGRRRAAVIPAYLAAGVKLLH